MRVLKTAALFTALVTLVFARRSHAEELQRAAPVPPAADARASAEKTGDTTDRASEAPAYRVVRSHTWGIAGGSSLGQSYTTGALIASVALLGCATGVIHPSGGCAHLSPGLAAFRELFIPIAGPWLAVARDDVQEHTAALLVFAALGTAQAAGLALIAYDLALPRYTVVSAQNLSVMPVADGRNQMLIVRGAF